MGLFRLFGMVLSVFEVRKPEMFEKEADQKPGCDHENRTEGLHGDHLPYRFMVIEEAVADFGEPGDEYGGGESE